MASLEQACKKKENEKAEEHVSVYMRVCVENAAPEEKEMKKERDEFF